VYPRLLQACSLQGKGLADHRRYGHKEIPLRVAVSLPPRFTLSALRLRSRLLLSRPKQAASHRTQPETAALFIPTSSMAPHTIPSLVSTLPPVVGRANNQTSSFTLQILYFLKHQSRYSQPSVSPPPRPTTTGTRPTMRPIHYHSGQPRFARN